MNKKITTLSLILVLAMTTLIGGISIANAQPPDKKTYTFVGLIPNTVGVGQEVLVHMGINTPTGGPEWGWVGLTATVTRPDGTTQTLGPKQLTQQEERGLHLYQIRLESTKCKYTFHNKKFQYLMRIWKVANIIQQAQYS